MKRMISLILALLLIGMMIPLGTFAASAASSGTTGDCTWTLDDNGVLTISGNGKMADYYEWTMDSQKVTSAAWGYEITAVVIENGVTNIGQRAFLGCRKMTSITIPATVTEIKGDAVKDCCALTSITVDPANQHFASTGNCLIDKASKTLLRGSTTSLIPEDGSVTAIADGAFSYCAGLTSIVIPAAVKTIGANAFMYCSGLNNVVIRQGVSSIGESAFQYCSGLTAIDIPGSVTSIGASAFTNCKLLADVTIGQGVTSLGSSAFSWCAGLTSIIIPGSIKTVSSNAFYCSGLTEAVLEEGVTAIGANAFCSSHQLTTVTLPRTLTSIGVYAFLGCDALRTVNFPEGLTTIGSGAFERCESLESLALPTTLTSIGGNAFSECNGLTSVTIPGSVKIAKGFSSCTALAEVILEEGVTEIGSGCFSYCHSLVRVDLPDTLTAVRNNAFYCCSALGLLALPDAVTTVEKNAVNYTAVYVKAGSAAHKSAESNKVPYLADHGTCGDLTWTADAQGHLTVSGNGPIPDYEPRQNPQNIAEIISTAPWGSHVTAVTIENGVTAIGVGAFYNCTRMTKATLSETVKSVGNKAFLGCTGLADESGLVIVGGKVFDYCGEGGDLVIPDGVTAIDDGVFFHREDLRFVDVPDTLTTIGEGAFAVIGTSLTPYYYPSGFALRGNGSSPAAKIAAERGIPFLPIGGTGGVTGDCTWFLDDEGNLTIAGEGDTDDYDVTTGPDGSHTWTTAPWGDCIRSLTVEEGVTYLGANAFYGCKLLTEVTLADTVEGLGYQAFANCTGLTELELPDVTWYVEERAFYGCTGLADENGFIILGGVLYQYLGRQSDIVIPEGVTVIDSNAFTKNSSIRSVTTPDSLVQIRSGAFTDCSNLPRTNDLVMVGNWCYWNSSSATSITVPYGTVGIADGAFSNPYKNITAVSLPSTLRYIGSYAFSDNYSLTEVDLPNSVIYLGTGAFFNCVALKKVTEHASVLAFGEAAFSVWYEGDEFYSPLPELTVYTSEGTLMHQYAEAYDIPVVLSAHVHNVSDWITLVPPTCTEKGMEIRGCYFCDDLTETRETDALGHDYRDEATPPTCTEAGYTTHVCARCGDAYTDGSTPALGHAFGDWTQTKAPTCTQKGEETRACAACDATETREIDALGHDYAVAAHRDAGGRVDGYDGHTCSRCGVLKIDAVLPATGIATDLAGDLDWDDAVTDDDAIWLLMYTFFPEDYPIDDPAACDFDGDGEVDDDDAIWLLMYTFFPEDYPIA